MARARSFKRPSNVRGFNEDQTTSITTLCNDLPPVVYFISTDDGLIKIGYTTDLAARKRWFGQGWTRILAVTPGTMETEAELHQRFKAHRARGREFYHPHTEIISHINELRRDMNLSVLADPLSA